MATKLGPGLRRGDGVDGRYVVPDRLLESLAQTFDVPFDTIDRIRVIEHSRFARLHGRHVAATTRRNAIYLSGSGDAFVADLELVLHEYFHVIRQWNCGTLTVGRYLRESARRGYKANRYEAEAREFASECAPSLAASLGSAPVRPATSNRTKSD